MNYYFLAAGLLTMLIGIIHSIVGEVKLISPIQHLEKLPPLQGSVLQTKRTLRFAWHVTSVLGMGIGAVLVFYATEPSLPPPERFVLIIIDITLSLSFIVSLIGSRGKHPAWVGLLIASGLLTYGYFYP